MATIRGRAKQDLRRATTLARHIQEQVAWISKEYNDFDLFSMGCETVVVSAAQIEKLLIQLEREMP